MDEIYIYTVPLPAGCNEAVLPCSDGYTIYINDGLDHAGRIKALKHALKHIGNRDFDKCDVQRIEDEAHRKDV